MNPIHHGVPHGDMPRGKPIRLVTSGLHSQYTRITHPGTERSIGLSSVWLTLQPSPSNSDFCKTSERADMTSRLIGSGLFDCPSCPVRAKVKCCKSHDLFGCQIKDCSATRIPSLRIMGRHPWPTGSLIGRSLPLCRGAVGVFYSPSRLGGGSRVKWSNPGKGVAPSSTPQCSSYWKGMSHFSWIC